MKLKLPYRYTLPRICKTAYRLLGHLGSSITDGTQNIIKNYLKTFQVNSTNVHGLTLDLIVTRAMILAKGKSDYLLFIDADDRLIVSDQFVIPPLEADVYLIMQREAYKSVFREHNTVFMIKNNADFKWKGVLHECLVSETPKKLVLLHNIFNEYVNDGHRSKDPEKITKDIYILKEADKKDPTGMPDSPLSSQNLLVD